MEDMELVCFKIISAVGEAKSDYILAIEEAEKGNFERAEELIAEGDACYTRGHQVNASLIQQEASGEKVEVVLLLMHAEDQLMAAETTKLLATKLINLYKNK